MKSKNDNLTISADKTFTIKAVVPKSSISREYHHLLKHAAEGMDIKGFRPGKAPLDLVEKNLSREQVIETIAQNLLPEIYEAEIKKHNLNPVLSPKIRIINSPVTLDNDWEVEFVSCELPEVKINDQFAADVKKINEDKNKAKDNHLDLILQTLLKHTKVTLPSFLLETELNHRLSRLIDQVQQAGLTVNGYLKNHQLTLEQYKQAQEAEITKEWTLDLALNQIAKDQKLTVNPEEVEKLSQTQPQPQNFNPQTLAYLILQQKTLDYLKSL